MLDCRAVTDSLAGLKASAPETIVYKTVGGRALRLYVFRPSGRPTGCVLNVHGGGWHAETPERLFPHAAYFARQGALGVCVEYRLIDDEMTAAPGFTPGVMRNDLRDALSDCVDALAYIRRQIAAEYGDLPVTALGDSAGGYLAACLGCARIVKRFGDVKRADFAVDLNGIVDLTGKWQYGLPASDDWLARYRLLRELSPTYNVSSDDAPALIVHGLKDTIVEPADSAAYYCALKAAGVAADLQLLPAANHAFILFDYTHDNAYSYAVLCDIAGALKERNLI